MIYLQIFSGASNMVEGVDRSFMVIFSISLFFLMGITATMIYFIVRYRKTRNPKATQIDGSNTLEIIWTVVPLILVMVMFFYGYRGYVIMREVPEDAMNIKVNGYMWDWDFEYENGKVSKDLYLPINKPVKLNLYSLDVIHSLYIPAFRVKEDAVPGKENYMWFTAQLEGEYEVLCAEYCGLRHSYMEAKAVVIPQEKFDTWLADYHPELNKDPRGLEILKANACTGCHSLDGSKLVGPSFKGIFGIQRIVLVAGKEKTVTVDEDYLLKSIKEPNAEVVKDYPANVMQSYSKVLTNEDMGEIVTYIKTLK
jgi:cytochrome c oxidase subunit 2